MIMANMYELRTFAIVAGLQHNEHIFDERNDCQRVQDKGQDAQYLVITFV